MKSLLFVHVPKTAGTSFRQAAINEFGSAYVIQDYGTEAPETSELILRYVYTESNHWVLYKHLEKLNARLVCGHMRAKKFMPGIGVRNTAIIFREPVQRVYSEYQHFVRNKGYSGSFRDFYLLSRNCNVQAKRADGVPLRALGVVGLTERYDETLRIINHCYGLSLKALVKNTGRKSLDKAHDISAEDRKEVLRLNHKDVALYERACVLFEERLALHEKGLPYAHGSLVMASPKKVAGWAWWEGGEDDPVELDVRVNGKVQARVQAQRFRYQLSQFRPPRGGHAGFSAKIHARPGDKVDCVVCSTGQVIPPTPKVVESGVAAQTVKRPAGA